MLEVEKNNTTLLALKKRVEAETIGNKSGITISNPEAEFNYLWGSPGILGTAPISALNKASISLQPIGLKARFRI